MNQDNPKYIKPEFPYNFSMLPARTRYKLAYQLARIPDSPIDQLQKLYRLGVINRLTGIDMDRTIAAAIKTDQATRHQDGLLWCNRQIRAFHKSPPLSWQNKPAMIRFYLCTPLFGHPLRDWHKF